jgi:hypothetical protein
VGTLIAGRKKAAKRLGLSLEEYQFHREKCERWCSVCRSWKNESDFYKSGGSCIKCQLERSRKRTASPRGRNGGIAKAARAIGVSVEQYTAMRNSGYLWCGGCRTWLLTGDFSGFIRKSGGRRCLKCMCLRNTARKYSISHDRVVDLHSRACEICGKKDGKREIDHCHKTGVVRGTLCPKCNKGLGHFLDNAVNLKRAIEYLEKFDSTLRDNPALRGSGRV